MSTLENSVAEALKKRGYSYKNGDSSKKILNFEKSNISQPLFEFLQLHPACRSLFNVMVKADDLTVESILPKLNDVFKQSNTSFLFSAKCKNCGLVLTVPNISEYDFNFPAEFEMHCPKCHKKVKITKEIYEPIFPISKNDLHKVFHQITLNFNFLYVERVYECIWCDNSFNVITDVNKIELECPACHHEREISRVFSFDKKIQTLVKDKQGHWLEWYIWKQLKSVNAECGLNLADLKDPSNNCEIDVCLSKDDKLVVIECKDSDDFRKTIENLDLFGKIADKYYLICTKKVQERQLRPFKSLLKHKFEFVPLDRIDHIFSFIIQNS